MANSTAALNPVLTGRLNKFMVDPQGFVARDLFPPFFTASQSGDYVTYERSNLINIPKLAARAPGTRFAESQSKKGKGTFSCQDYGHKEPVDRMQRQIYANQLDADNAANERNGVIMLVNWERRVADKVKAMTAKSSPNTKWDAENSKPIDDIRAAKSVIHVNCGMDPNLMVVSRVVVDVLADHPQFVDRMKYTTGDSITEEMLARFFGIERVRVAGGIENAANEGQAEDPAYLWGSDVVLAVTNPAQQLEALNLGRTFAWSVGNGGGRNLAHVRSWIDEDRDSTIHLARSWLDERTVAEGAGYLLENTLT